MFTMIISSLLLFVKKNFPAPGRSDNAFLTSDPFPLTAPAGNDIVIMRFYRLNE